MNDKEQRRADIKATAEDQDLIDKSKSKMAGRDERAKGLALKAGAMGDDISPYGTKNFEAGDKAFDAVQNTDESMAEDAKERIKRRKK